jgi:hypothetical protein
LNAWGATEREEEEVKLIGLGSVLGVLMLMLLVPKPKLMLLRALRERLLKYPWI